MAAKIAIQNITDLGFQPSQFGSPPDWVTEATGYLARIINRIGVVVADVVGITTYESITGGALLSHLERAEEQFVAAELWRRMEGFERGMLAMNGGAKDGETIGSRLLANAEQAEELAWHHLSKVTGEDYGGGGLIVGSVASGTFAESAS